VVDDAAAQREATKLHDLAVVGGGLIGAAAALGAAQQGLRVVLLDRVRPVWRPGRLGMDVRNVAVSPASQGLLHRLGVWRDQDAVPYTHMRVWEERGTRAIEFDAAEVARGELGWILENGPLVDRLWRKLAALDKLDQCLGNRLIVKRILYCVRGRCPTYIGTHFEIKTDRLLDATLPRT